MIIKTIYDVRDNWEELKNKEITYYEGAYMVSTKDGYDKNFQLNTSLFHVLRDNGWLNYEQCVVSHRAVSIYTWSYPLWEELEEYLDAYRKLIKLVANKTFRQKHELIDFLADNDYVLYDSSVLAYASYWGGTRYQKAMKIRTPNMFKIWIPLGSSYKDNFSRKSDLAISLLIQYARLVGLPLIGFDDYSENQLKQRNNFYKNLCKKIESGSWSDKFIEYEVIAEKEKQLVC
jgi:hypothetical protein